jgi:hypothetical protein
MKTTTKTLKILILLFVTMVSFNACTDSTEENEETIEEPNTEEANVDVMTNSFGSAIETADVNFFNINEFETNTLNAVEFSITEKNPTNPSTAGQFGNSFTFQVKELPAGSKTYNHIGNTTEAHTNSNFTSEIYVFHSVKINGKTWFSIPNKRHDAQLVVSFNDGKVMFSIADAVLHESFSADAKTETFSLKFEISESELKDSNNTYKAL